MLQSPLFGFCSSISLLVREELIAMNDVAAVPWFCVSQIGFPSVDLAVCARAYSYERRTKLDVYHTRGKAYLRLSDIYLGDTVA